MLKAPARSGGRPDRRSCAFSLVELLVVIAIATVMIALLLPALRSAREAAMAVTCLAKLRQWGVTTYAFTTDEDGRLPRGIEYFHP